MPIALRGENIGSLIVQVPANERVNADQMDLIRAVAERVALSAENARLFEETNRRAEREQVISDISAKILTVSERVEMIAMASRDQSTGLAEVNASVNAMDHMTQKNAAMVEETNAATRQLAQEADTMMMLVDQFKLSATAGHSDHAERRVA